MPANPSPVARGPLLDLHRATGATIGTVEGWRVATHYPQEPDRQSNALVDLSHWTTYDVNGPQTGASLISMCGADVPLRTIHVEGTRHVYRLTPTRAIVFGTSPSPTGAVNVTGGWASLALFGPDVEAILNKITAVDLRERTLPIGGCCQGPIFGVNTLFGRYANHMLLHVCPDSAQFFWELILDAGQEFNLRAAGANYYK